ncbi:heavy metal translocating P-type ATPase [Paralcaligenes ginsengisoli]
MKQAGDCGHSDHGGGSVHQHESHGHAAAAGGCCVQGDAALAALARPVFHERGTRTAMRIMQMDCPTEEALIRRKLESMDCVHAVEFNLMQRVLTVDHAVDSETPILAAIRSLGFTPELPGAGQRQGKSVDAPARHWWPLALGVALALCAEMFSWWGYAPWLSVVAAVSAIAFSGLGTYKKGLVAVFNGTLNINALMSIAVSGAVLLGHWPEAAMVMVLFAIAELIEARSLDRVRHAIESLMQIVPETVTMRQGDGTWAEVEAAQVTPGAIVRVKPGERVGLDGVIVSGCSVLDQAPITGESLPVDKTVGDEVYAGTINGAGAFEYRVVAASDNTMLARIIHAVQEAQSGKAPTQRFVDRFSAIYTPIVCGLALLAALLPPLFLGGAWLDWAYKALVLLVIACPCALVISTPVAIVSGLAAAARHGILIKGGVYLEQGRKLMLVALDKTGTITQGKPVQTDFEPLAGLDAAACRRLAASLASGSDHPVSRAIAAAHMADGVEAGGAGGQDLLPVTGFEAVAGGGLRGTINGSLYLLGNYRLIRESGYGSPALEARLDTLERQGKTAVVLAGAGQALALFAVADTVKESSRQAIADLHEMGVRTVMLSGDNTHTAQAIAAQVGITEVLGSQLPQDKLAAIDGYATRGIVGMVGDGINDAPALARADVGFAMGAMGTDTAIETADVALMDDDLRKIPRFVRLSRSTHAVLVQNIALALSIKVLFLALTLLGLGTMWMAVFADVGASLLVVGNALRLLRR